MKPITIFEAFAGIGSQIMSLKNLGIPTKSAGVSEVNEAAILSYAAIHADSSIFIPDTTADCMQAYMEKLNIPLNDKGKRIILKGKRLERLYKASKAIHNFGDISKINPVELDDLTLFTYSFPCQSISFAGLQHGLAKDSNTRSSLLWECERIIEAKKPDYLLMENVKALVSKTFKPDFDKWCALLEELGYTNYWQVLNARNFGVPQNRERVFMVSIRNDLKQSYTFPKAQTLTTFVQDVLEPIVDESFYLKKDIVDKLCLSDKKLEAKLKEYAMRDHMEVDSNQTAAKIAAMRGRYKANPQSRQSGLPTAQHLEISQTNWSNTITTIQKDNLVVYADQQVLGIDYHPIQSKRSYRHFVNSHVSPCIIAHESKVPKTVAIYQRPRGFNKGAILEKVAPTISSHSWQQNNFLLSDFLRIRKLTPKECWRLMGFDDVAFEKASQVTSNTQLYKQAGNSIVVPVLEAIFKELFFPKITGDE